MDHNHSVCIFVFLFNLIVIIISSSIGVNELFVKYSIDNYKVPNVFNVVKTNSLLRCCDLCVLSNNCNALNYKKSNNVCELTNNIELNPQTFLLEAGWRIYYVKVDACTSNPCLNSGTCVETELGYSCQCNVGWHGDHCETNINECASNPCVNGGVCVDNINYYICTCTSEYTGTICETQIDINECASNPCVNGGVCVDNINYYICTCTSEYTGTICETQIAAVCDGLWVEYSGSCYLLVKEEKSWNNAKARCESYSSHLVDIKTQTEMAFLKLLYQDNFESSDLDHEMWTGGNDIVTDGVRQWSDGTYMSDYWSDMDPDTEDKQECVWFIPAEGYIWYDGPCVDKEYFICEKP